MTDQIGRRHDGPGQGVGHAALRRTRAVIERGLSARWHVGAQLYVSRDGLPIVDEAVGDARAGVPMRTGTIMLWFSSSKPITAVAIAQLWERGKLDLNDRVCSYLPAFGTGGKGAITVRHILTHTGGFLREWPWQEYYALPWDEVIDRICKAELEQGWIPGHTAGYHPASGWFILGELIRRIDGRSYDRYVREAIFQPLGMDDSWVGMPPDRYRAYGDRLGVMHDTTGAEPQPYPPDLFDTAEAYARCNPGERGRGPIRELGYLYEMLLGHGRRQGTRLLLPQTVEALTAPHRVGLHDRTYGHLKNWALGFALDVGLQTPGGSFVPRTFGPACSPRVFGHAGYNSSVGFADPEYHLVVAAVFNGTPSGDRAYERTQALITVIYRDLDLRQLEKKGRRGKVGG